MQTLTDKTLHSLNRSYESATSVPLTEQKAYLKDLSRFVNVNLDFIINFNAEVAEQKQLINFVGEVKPQHVSLYALEVNEGSFLERNQQMFSSAIGQYDHYSWLSERLTKDFGYEHYEVSNFAYPTRNSDGQFERSKHNQTYLWGDKEFAGFGMGATSLSNGLRITRPTNLRKYYQFVQQLKVGAVDEKLIEINDESHWQ
jgi:oxygen-independent coproporphyrinogen-3 oxidase